MTEPLASAVALKAELAASIDRTLSDEARRNEQAIAAVRATALVAVLFIEGWLLSGPSALGAAALPAALGTLAYLGFAVAVWIALRRGLWSPWLTWVFPVTDLTYLGLRVSVVFGVAGLAHATRMQELATVVGMVSIVAMTGAFRLQTRAVTWSTGLAIATYALFARWMDLPAFQAVVHLVTIGTLGAMAHALTAIVRRVVHHEVTRLTLRRLLPASVVEEADSDPMALLTEPRSLDATIVVTDLRGFTTWAEHRAPLEVLGTLNDLQGALAACVLAHGGTVDKFMGDGMLAVFGAPRPSDRHADDALAAVDDMLAAMARFPVFALGVGVHSGEVVVGCLGSGIRMEFTVLGDTVNAASRLESATKEHGVAVLISDTVRSRSARTLEGVGRIPLRGRTEPVQVWTLGRPAA